MTVVMPTSTASGPPTFKKSEPRYPPGPYTMRLVWYPTGVAKADAAATVSPPPRAYGAMSVRARTTSANAASAADRAAAADGDRRGQCLL